MKGIAQTVTQKTTLACLALIIAIGLIPLTWYHSSYTIISGDNSPLWFNSPKTLPGDLNMWLDSGGLGHTSGYPTLAALLIPMYTLQVIGIPNGLIQVIFLSVSTICSGLSMFYLLSVLLGKKLLPQLVGSLFYMLCIIFILTTLSLITMWSHAFLPLILAFFIQLIRKRVRHEPSRRTLITFVCACSIFLSFLTINPPNLIIALISLFIAFLYVGLTENFLKTTLESLKITVPVLLASLWWIIPFALLIAETVSAPGQSLSPRMNFTDYRSSILNILWFNPLWIWSSTYYQYIAYYSNAVVIVATFVPIVVASIGLIFRRKDDKMRYLFFAIILVMIILAKGTHSPLPQINNALDRYIPEFGTLFREPESKFTPIIALLLAPLIACTVDSLAKKAQFAPMKTEKKKMALSSGLITITVISILITAGPFFLGQIAPTENDAIPYSSYIKVPDYWMDADQFFANDTADYRVLVTPDDTSLYNAYNWGYWGTDCIPLRYIQKPVLYNTYGYQQSAGNDILNMTYYALENRSYTAFGNLLSCLNVKYILLRHDIVWNFSSPPTTDPSIIQNALGNCSDLRLVKTQGQLDIYEYKNWAPTHFTTSITPFSMNTSLLLHESSVANNNAATLTYAKVSPSEYRIHIDANQPFYLFFAESYNKKWKISDSNSEWYSALVNNTYDSSHTSAYGFGNAWFINRTGSYDIVIFYEPQSSLYLGIIISVITILSIFAFECILIIKLRGMTKKC